MLDISVSNPIGCSITDQVFLQVKQALAYYIPNAFSLNKDQINDRFFVSENSNVQAIKKM